MSAAEGMRERAIAVFAHEFDERGFIPDRYPIAETVDAILAALTPADPAPASEKAAELRGLADRFESEEDEFERSQIHLLMWSALRSAADLLEARSRAEDAAWALRKRPTAYYVEAGEESFAFMEENIAELYAQQHGSSVQGLYLRALSRPAPAAPPADTVKTRSGHRVTLTSRNPFRGTIEGHPGVEYKWDSCGNNKHHYLSLDHHPLDLAEDVWRAPPAREEERG